MIGIDIIEIDRIARAAQKCAFLSGVFTVAEQEYWKQKGEKAETLAGMFCAKEAAAKAAGTGVRGFRLTDIEVCHTAMGAPYLRFYHGAATVFDGYEVLVSISHHQSTATAVCVLIKKP